MSVTIRLEGLDDLQRKLGANFSPLMRAATTGIAADIQKEIAPYPPATLANSPTQKRWYERGYGTKYRRLDGGITGRKTSQALGRSWGIKSSGSIGAELGSRATYSPYVHSDKLQADFHKRRGWKTDKQAVEKVIKRGVVEKHLRAVIRKGMGI